MDRKQKAFGTEMTHEFIEQALFNKNSDVAKLLFDRWSEIFKTREEVEKSKEFCGGCNYTAQLADVWSWLNLENLMPSYGAKDKIKHLDHYLKMANYTEDKDLSYCSSFIFS